MKKAVIALLAIAAVACGGDFSGEGAGNLIHAASIPADLDTGEDGLIARQDPNNPWDSRGVNPGRKPAVEVPGAARAETGQVIRVIDGDTVDVLAGTETMRVRLVGVDTPEMGDCGSDDATTHTARLVEGQRVQLWRGGGETPDVDKYGRALRHITTSNTWLNAELVAEGHARAVEYQPHPNAGRFAALEREAQRTNTGIWGDCSR